MISSTKTFKAKYHHKRQSLYFIFSILILIIIINFSNSVLYSKQNSRGDSRMINYTNVAATAFNMPKLGLGTLSISSVEVKPVINEALSLGYRLFDCAPGKSVYFNEMEIGDAFHESTSNVPRTDVFITSKLASPFHRPEHVEPAVRKTLNDLRVGYLDLYLVHWPVAFKYVEIDPLKRGWENEDIDESDKGKRIDPTVSIRDTWTAMESLVDKGLVKHIGVANFPAILLHDLLSYSRIPPAVNQVEIHPYNQQRTPGYKEDGEPNVLEDPILKEIANGRGITVAQLCLQWTIQRGCHVVAKSSSVSHLQENMLVNHKDEFVVDETNQLTQQEMDRIASLDRGYRFFRPEEWWPDAPVAVFD